MHRSTVPLRGGLSLHFGGGLPGHLFPPRFGGVDDRAAAYVGSWASQNGRPDGLLAEPVME